MTKNNKNILEWLHKQEAHERCPSFPYDYIPPYGRTDKDTNGLTCCIIDFLNLIGHQAERISSTGRIIDRTKVVTDSLGFRRTIGSKEFVKGTGIKGTADISATINGLSVKIEVKFGKDRQSQDQKGYEAEVNKAGGYYFIARNFDMFLEWYVSTFVNGKERFVSAKGVEFIIVSKERRIIQRTDYYKQYEITEKQFASIR